MQLLINGLVIALVILAILIIIGVIPFTQEQDTVEVERASTTHVALISNSQIDGTVPQPGHKYLLQYQNDPSQNGVYLYKHQKWTKQSSHVQIIHVKHGTYANQIIIHKPGNTASLRVGTLEADQIKGTLDTAAQPNVTSLGTQKSPFNVGSHRILNVGDPLIAADAVNKGYTDNYVQGMIWLAEVHVDADSNLAGTWVGDVFTADPAAALGTISGYSSWSDGSTRILLRGQTNKIDNGIYVVQQNSSPWQLVRAEDMDNSPTYETQIGTGTYVANGIYAGRRYIISTPKTDLAD